jgi:hypothetical protein
VIVDVPASSTAPTEQYRSTASLSARSTALLVQVVAEHGENDFNRAIRPRGRWVCSPCTSAEIEVTRRRCLARTFTKSTPVRPSKGCQ